MTKVNKFHITFVLDRSGSMQTVRDATISGFNEYLQSQKDAPGKAKVTLIQFDDRIEIPYENVKIKDVKPLTHATFVPRGMTALRDAIETAIRKTEQALVWGENVKPLIVILTDGLENSSRRINQFQLNTLISQKQEQGWDFVYIGANQDAFAVGTSMGIRGDFTYSYDANPIATASTFGTLSSSSTAYRGFVTTNGLRSTANYNFFAPSEVRENEDDDKE